MTLFNPSYDKDKFENTALTVNGQDRRPEARVQRRLPGAQCRAGTGLYELRPRRIRLLLSMHGLVEQRRRRGQVLHAEHDLAGHRKEHAPEPRDSLEHARRVAAYARSAACTRRNSRSTTIPNGCTRAVPTCTPAFDTNCFNNIQPWPGVAGEPAGHTKRQRRVLRRFPAHIIQKAAFGSVDFDMIPKTLTVTAGTRYYRFNEDGARRQRGQLLLQGLLDADHVLRALLGALWNQSGYAGSPTARSTPASGAAPT